MNSNKKIEVDGKKGAEAPVVVVSKDNTLNFALNRIQSCLSAASEERLRELEHWEQLAARWQSEGDHCGYNFHQGMAAGANYVDIFYHRIGREVDAIRATQNLADSPGQIADDLDANQQWLRNITPDRFESPLGARSCHRNPALKANAYSF